MRRRLVKPRQWLKNVVRLSITFLFLLLFGLIAVPFYLGFMTMWNLTRGDCIRLPGPEAYNLPYETVQVSSGDLSLNAYFIPAESDAAVIIAPVARADAGAALDYAAMFHEVGLNVLALGARQCVGGVDTLGHAEGDDVVAAYTYLVGRGDISPERVSAHGFSAAGAAALFGAAREPNIRAVSAMGNYADFTTVLGEPAAGDAWVAALYKLGATWGYERGAGVQLERLKPVEVIDEIAPRPMLFIYGSEERSLAGGRQMAAVAGDAGQLWIVPGVGHGGYLQAYPDDVRERLGGFHRAALLDAKTFP